MFYLFFGKMIFSYVDFVTVGPILKNLFQKIRKTQKKIIIKFQCNILFALKNYHEYVEGGG